MIVGIIKVKMALDEQLQWLADHNMGARWDWLQATAAANKATMVFSWCLDENIFQAQLSCPWPSEFVFSFAIL